MMLAKSVTEEKYKNENVRVAGTVPLWIHVKPTASQH